MYYPKLREIPSSRKMIKEFKGYNSNLQIGDGEFGDMQNLVSDFYPALAPRGQRGVYASPAAPGGLIAKDVLCYVDGTEFVMGDTRVDMGLNEEPKQLISMGAYVIILPDRKYINTMDAADFGDIDASFQSEGSVSFTLCTLSGEDYGEYTVSDTAPAEPANQALWLDTSAEKHSLKRYSEATGLWVSIATTYVKISCAGIGKQFKQHDGVEISGIENEALKSLNGFHVVWGCGDDYILVVGIVDKTATQTSAVTVTRQMPIMDFVIESDNRLWGCRYGLANNGEFVNEIYASKLGDFKNWNCFMNVSTDSYRVSCGSDGAFTGAITHRGYPLFFKENCLHKVYGSYPANFRVQSTECRGVQKGSHRSLAIVNETLFYKSTGAVCAYDGSLPVEVSYALGTAAYSHAAAGSNGNKYYISMKDVEDAWHLFVYDTTRRMWHREDNLRAEWLCPFRGELYAIDYDTKKIITMLGTGTKDTRRVKWMAQTGIIGTDMPGMKYVSNLLVRMSLAIGTKVRFLVQYDSLGVWEHITTITGRNLRSFDLPIRPRRCDHLRLRIEGEGEAKVYAITKTIEQGSDIS